MLTFFRATYLVMALVMAIVLNKNIRSMERVCDRWYLTCFGALETTKGAVCE